MWPYTGGRYSHLIHLRWQSRRRSRGHRESGSHSHTPIPTYSHVTGVDSGQTEPRSDSDAIYH